MGGGPAGVTRGPSGPPASGQSSQLGSCRSGFYSWTSSHSDTHPLVILARSYDADDAKHFYLQPRSPSSSRARAKSWDSSQTPPPLTPTLNPSPRRAMVPPKGLLLLPADSLPFLPASTHPQHSTPSSSEMQAFRPRPGPCSLLTFSSFPDLAAPRLPPPIPADTQAAPTSVPLPLPLL